MDGAELEMRAFLTASAQGHFPAFKEQFYNTSDDWLKDHWVVSQSFSNSRRKFLFSFHFFVLFCLVSNLSQIDAFENYKNEIAEEWTKKKI